MNKVDAVKEKAVNCLTRQIDISPSMCGHNSLFVGRLGDWTWEAVATACDTGVFHAVNDSGQPTYLAFYYFHVSASRGFHPGQLSFGDKLTVTSNVFGLGSESILTAHRIGRRDDEAETVDPLDLEELHVKQRPGCIYVENFNRWISRSKGESNVDLVKSSPRGFRYEHLPALSDKYSPRAVCIEAKQRKSFFDENRLGTAVTEHLNVEYPIDVTRDINGVGLVYFTTYFSIADRCVLQLWLKAGRSQQSFMNRITLDHKLLFLGNADPESTVQIYCQMWSLDGTGAGEGLSLVNLEMHDRQSGRLIAVSSIEIACPEEVDGG